MRWESLFGDLEAQWEAEVTAELESEIAEAERLERSGQLLAARLRAHRDSELALLLPGGRRMQIRLGIVGEDWLCGAVGHAEVVVPLWAVLAIGPLERGAEPEGSQVRKSLGIGAPLRVLARNRAVVSVYGPQGELVAEGLLAAVGRDHLDVTLGVPGEVPRRGNLRGLRTVPFTAATMVWAEGGGLEV